MKPRCLLLCIGFVIALLGCAEERPTQVRGASKLHSTPISSTLVTSFSDRVDATVQPDGSGVLDFQDAALHQKGTVDDISISCSGRYPALAGPLLVFCDTDSTWHEFPAALPSGPRPYLDFCYTETSRLTSEVAAACDRNFLGTNATLRIMAAGSMWYQGWLVSYSPDYHFATVRTEEAMWYTHSSLGILGNSLFIPCSYVATPGTVLSDSLVSVDFAGSRRWSVPMTSSYPRVSAFGGGSVWLMDLAMKALSRVDTLGQIVATAAIGTETFTHLAYVNGNLWGARNDREQQSSLVYEIDIDSTFAGGTLVAHLRFTLDDFRVGAMTADTDGLFIAHENYLPELFRYSFDGIKRERFDISVGIKAMAWDGENLWVLHHGPVHAVTNATLLSRFTLE